MDFLSSVEPSTVKKWLTLLPGRMSFSPCRKSPAATGFTMKKARPALASSWSAGSNASRRFTTASKAWAKRWRALSPNCLGKTRFCSRKRSTSRCREATGFLPHQDSQAGWDTYADFFISALVSVDKATEENGCLQMVRGHHKSGLAKSWEPLTEEDMQGMEFLPVPTDPGDVVFFDCYAPHASEANLSSKIRRIYYATYNRVSAGDHMDQYYADKHKNYPPDIDRQPDKEYVFRV